MYILNQIGFTHNWFYFSKSYYITSDVFILQQQMESTERTEFNKYIKDMAATLDALANTTNIG